MYVACMYVRYINIRERELMHVHVCECAREDLAWVSRSRVNGIYVGMNE